MSGPWLLWLVCTGEFLGLLVVATTPPSTHVGPPPTPARILTIGAVLSDHQYGRKFQDTIENINRETGALPPGILLNSSYILMDDNPIRAAQAICASLIPNQVYVVIASHPLKSDLSPLAVSFTCGFYSIPVIGISARNSAFSDKVSS